MPRSAIGGFALRFALIYVLLGGLVVAGERPLATALAPLVKLGLGAGANIEVRDVTCEGHRLIAQVLVTRPNRLGPERHVGARVVANGDMLLVGPLLALSAVAAFRYRSRRRFATAVAVGLVTSLVLSAHDVAATIAAGVRTELGAVDSVSGFYSFFIDAGGRQLLALLAAALAIGITAPNDRPSPGRGMRRNPALPCPPSGRIAAMRS